MRQIDNIEIENIELESGRREVDAEAVARLQESISEIGLLTPISVRIVDQYPCANGEIVDGVPVLVTGAHRLTAAKRLGWQRIECFVVEDCDELDAKRAEIAENLHRAELSAQQRSDQIAEWIRLTEEKQAQEVSAQVVQKPQGGRPEGGRSAAARELGINREQARRAEKIASLSDEAKEAARDAGLDDNQSALERAARAESSEEQVQAINEIAEQRERRRTEAKACKSDRDFDRLHDAWASADEQARDRFLDWLQANDIVGAA